MTRGSKIERVEIEIKFTNSLSPLNIGTLTGISLGKLNLKKVAYV